MNNVCRVLAEPRANREQGPRRAILAGMYLLWTMLLVAAFSVAGCSKGDQPDLGDVQGTVTLDGQPLAQATVVFRPAGGGRASQGITNEAGKYEIIYIRDIKGAKLGSHKVAITTATETNPEERVPAQYNRQTTLTAEIQPGTNQCDFDLTTK